MARSLSCEYDMEIPELAHISPQAKDLVARLLVLDSTLRYFLLCLTRYDDTPQNKFR